MTLDVEKFAVYAVGGYVRDRLLGRDPKDHDYVVVGATPDDMITAGFQHIDAAFPVFLHPITGDEYALARKERKVGTGYHGFECEFDLNVTLEDDLYRRDLTMNAMARKVVGWNEEGHAKLSDEIIDPYGGQHDLAQGVLRHVSDAFADDPVRVLRTARFAARYEFRVTKGTMQQMNKIAHELNHVPQERIWAEFEKGLMEKFPWLMFEVLKECGALDVDALKAYRSVDLMRLHKVKQTTPLFVRFCLVGGGFGANDYEICRVPTDLARVSKAFNTHVVDLFQYTVSTAEDRIRLFDATRAFSNINLLMDVVKVMGMYPEHLVPNDLEDRVLADLRAAMSVDAATIAASCKTGLEIKQKLFAARVAAMV